MRTNSRMMTRVLTLVVLTGAVGFAERVQAQQTGLFPLAPIQRKRVPCDQEDPTYKLYKQQYFGHHPTCWRTFPKGWGCPSGEAPDIEKSKKLFPPGNEPELLDEGMGEEGNAPVERQPQRPGIPEGPDPFNFNEEAPGAGLPNPLPGRGNAAPGRTTPAPRRANPPAGRSPFDELNPPGAAMSRPRGGNGARSEAVPAGPADEAPELSAPATPVQGSAYRSRSRTLDTEGQLAANSDDRPTLGLPEDDGPPVAENNTTSDATAGPLGSYSSPSSSPDSSTPAVATPAPAAQPRRRIFGNLFSSLGSRWIRR